MKLTLREFCGFRAGDKGDTADVALFAYDDAGYGLIVREVTGERVKSHFGAMVHETSTEGAPYSTGPPRVNVGISLAFFGAVAGDTAKVEFRYYSTFLLPMVRNQYVQIDNVRTPTYVPEPGTGVLVALAALGAWRRRTR